MKRDERPSDQFGSYDYPDERDDARLLGVSEQGEPVYYDPVAHVKLVGEREPKEALPDWASREELPDESDVGDLVEEIGEETGWDALTEFARDHLETSGSTETEESTAEDDS